MLIIVGDKVQDVTPKSPEHTNSSSPTVHTTAAHVPSVELPIPDETEPYERIPAECFTMTFDCKTSPGHICCAYHH